MSDAVQKLDVSNVRRFKPYPAYKPSGVEWLGDVPEHWEVKAIKWESAVLRGASPRPIDDPVYFDDEGEYAWVRISDVTSAGMYLEETTQRLSELGSSLSVRLYTGQLFLSIAGSVGKPCIAAIKCCIHDGFVYFPFWRGDSRFLYYIFASGEPYKGLGKLGTQLNLNTDTVGAIRTGFPVVAEQRAIADFLDRETAKIDPLIAKKRALIEKLNEKRSALISRTVTRGLPPDAACVAGFAPQPPLKPSGVNWVGDVPAHWEVKRIDFVSTVKARLGWKGLTADEYVNEGFIFLATPNISGQGEIDFENVNYITEERYLESPEIMLRVRDVLIAKDGSTLGITNVVRYLPAPGTVNSSIAVIRPKRHDRIDSRFLFRWLTSNPIQGIIQQMKDGQGVPHLFQADNKKFPVVLPPFPEQLAIAEFLDRGTLTLDSLVAVIAGAIDRLQEYRTALITAAVTGKIDVRGTAA